MKPFSKIVAACSFAAAATSLFSADIAGSGGKDSELKPYPRSPTPESAPSSSETENRARQFKIPAGMKLDLWAAEPMLANAVAFCLDEKGRVFVSETHRYRTSVLDIRHYMFMLEDDLACRTVEDRTAMVKKHFGTKWTDLAIESEVVRLLEDRSGSGKADFSSIYADKFDSDLDGIASGVLARKGKVWFTNIPEMTLLEGTGSVTLGRKAGDAAARAGALEVGQEETAVEFRGKAGAGVVDEPARAVGDVGGGREDIGGLAVETGNPEAFHVPRAGIAQRRMLVTDPPSGVGAFDDVDPPLSVALVGVVVSGEEVAEFVEGEFLRIA